MKYFDALPKVVSDRLEERGVDVGGLLYCVKADLDDEGGYCDVYCVIDKENLYIIYGNEEYKAIPKEERIKESMREVPIVRSFVKGFYIPEILCYNVTDFKEYKISDIRTAYVDRHQTSARLVLGLKIPGEPEPDPSEIKMPTPKSYPPPKVSIPPITGGIYSHANHGGGDFSPPPQPDDGIYHIPGHGGHYRGGFGSSYDKNRPNIVVARLSIGYAEKFEKFCERLNNIHRGIENDDSLLDAVELNCPICHQPYPDPNRPVCPRCLDRRSILDRLVGMFKDFKVEISLIFLTIIMSNVFAVVSPWFGSKMLYDDVIAPEGKYYGQVMFVIMLMVIVNLLGRIAGVVSGVITAKVVPIVTHKLRTRIYSTMSNLSLAFFTSKQTGSLMSRVDRDSQNVYNFFVDIVPYGVANVIKLVGVTAVMFWLSPVLSIAIILIIAMLLAADNYLYRSQRKLYRKLDVAMRSLNSVLSDVMNGQRVVKSFAKEDKERARYKKKNENAYQVNTRINDRILHTQPFMWSFYNIVSKALFCFGCFLVIKGQFRYGTLTALLGYTDMIYEPIDFFMWIGDRWARCIDAASRMFEILDAKPTVAEPENPVHIENMKGDIEFKNVSFEYEAGRPIIKNLSFKVEGGQMFGIVGKTGAGKSTIINLIARLYDVTGGEITIDGVPIKQIPTKDLRRNIGIVSQETYLFMGTVADNIRYARPDATIEEVIEAAKSANAHEFITKLPDGYNTKIGRGGHSLSGGERQRISIARAIIQDPNILILDEATASMDTKTERKIQVAIDGLKEGRTIISIAHRLSTLRDADMLCVIENGELREIGTHDELMALEGKYFELYVLQADALKFIEED